MTNNVGNPDPGLGQTLKCGRIKPVNETQSPLDTWISNGNTYINKREKKPAESLPLKKTGYYDNNERQHKHGQYNSRVKSGS